MQKTLELNPNHSNAHNFIGYIYSVRGVNLDKALEHLTKALAIQPKNGYFLDSLGWIYYQKGDSKRALTEIKRAMVYTSPDPVLYDHLGDVLGPVLGVIRVGAPEARRPADEVDVWRDLTERVVHVHDDLV